MAGVMIVLLLVAALSGTTGSAGATGGVPNATTQTVAGKEQVPTAATGPGAAAPVQTIGYAWTGTVRFDIVRSSNDGCTKVDGQGSFVQAVEGYTSVTTSGLGVARFTPPFDAVTGVATPIGSYSEHQESCFLDLKRNAHTTALNPSTGFDVLVGDAGDLPHVGPDGSMTFTWDVFWTMLFTTAYTETWTDSAGVHTSSGSSVEHFSSPHPLPVVTGTLTTSATSVQQAATATDPTSGTSTTITVALSRKGCYGATAAAGRALEPVARHAAATPAGCISITSPTPNAIIATTDRMLAPQLPNPANPSQRAPQRRSMTVTGTSCGCGQVKLNGLPATQGAGTWRVTLPDVKPGPLVLRATTAGGQTYTETVNVIELRVVDPAENRAVPLTAQATMPPLNARIAVIGYPGGLPAGITFRWTLNQYGVYKVRPAAAWAHPAPLANATGNTVGTAQHWQPKFRTTVGGFARIVVSATIPGALHNPVLSDPRWFDVQGTNPGKQAVLSYIATHAGSNAAVVQHLDCWESGRTYEQFNPKREPREPRTTGVPTDGWQNPSVLRPRYGAPPAGIGIAQLDPASFPAQQWNWQANVDGGIAIYRSKMTLSMGSRVRAQSVLNKEFTTALAAVNKDRAKKHLPALGGHALAIADMTGHQHIRDAIRRYNGGIEYRYAGHYRADLHTDTVKFGGTNTWLPVHHTKNAAYVTQVRTCSGLPILALPVPH